MTSNTLITFSPGMPSLIGHHVCVGFPVLGVHSLESSVPGVGLVQIHANTNPVCSQRGIRDHDLRSNFEQGRATTVTVPLLNRLFSLHRYCEETHHPVIVEQFQVLERKNHIHGVCPSVNLPISGFSMGRKYHFAGPTVTDNIDYSAFINLEPN